MDLAREMLRRALCDQLRSAVEHSQNTPYWMKRHMPAIHKETNKGIIMDKETPTFYVTLSSNEDDPYRVLAYEHGMRIYHEAEAPKWIDRNGSHSAADLLTENGWEIVSKWVQTLNPFVWSCFVRRIEDSED